MERKKFKPLIDKLYWIISIPVLILIAAMTLVVCFFPEPVALFIIVPVDFITIYFLVSSLFGYVELRENSLYVKYGLMLKKEIPYDKIRGAAKEHKFHSESMMSLKNAFEHVNIKYNTFDVTTVSVINNCTFIKELEQRISKNNSERG